MHTLRIIGFHLMILSLIQHSMAQPKLHIYQTSNPEVIATSNGQAYTEGVFQMGLQFTEFLLDARLSEPEKQAGRDQGLQDFYTNPKAFLDEAQQIHTQMSQIYQLQEPMTVALVRSALICQLYVALINQPQARLFMQWLDKYNRVLAYDATNQLVLTERDFQGMVELTTFQWQLLGVEQTLTNINMHQWRTNYVQQFLYSELVQKQTMSAMSDVAQITLHTFQGMSVAEQMTFKDQFLSTMWQSSTSEYSATDNAPNDDFRVEWPDGVTTKEEKQIYLRNKKAEMRANQFNLSIMNDISLNNHAVMLNMIEGMGGSDNYWEVKYH